MSESMRSKQTLEANGESLAVVEGRESFAGRTFDLAGMRADGVTAMTNRGSQNATGRAFARRRLDATDATGPPTMQEGDWKMKTAAPTGSAAPMRAMLVLVAVAAALALAFVPNARAASLDQIVQDATDGQIDGGYSASDLNAALASPLLKTYGGKNGVEAVKSALGTQTEGTGGSGELPFTGAEMITFAAMGSTLLIAGFVLRRTGRRDESG